MKVIRIYNFDGEGPWSTQRVVRGSLSEEEAKELARSMNADPKRSERDWFVAVPDDQKLFVFKP